MWSVTTLFTSSGIALSFILGEASTWAKGICSLTAASAATRVELVSP